jgi:lysophospholipase L1-like esterase
VTRCHWVPTWVSAPRPTEPADLPPAPFTRDELVLADSTLRQTIHTSIGGRQVRLRFCNAFGATDLPITAVSIALPVGGQAGVSAIEPDTSCPVTFDGCRSVAIQVGADAVSDPLTFDVPPQSNLAVTIYLAHGQSSHDITSHPGSRTTSYLLAGHHVTDPDLVAATPVDHWYFLSGVEVWSAQTGVIVLGDSLSDGRGSTTNRNDRWPDRLQDRLAGIAVLNQGAGGNRVLHDGQGPAALARLDRDVLAQSGINWLIVFEGVNDIGTAPATATGQQVVGEDLIAAYAQIITRGHARGIRVYGATITAFGGHTGYDDQDGHREATRKTVNDWIRTSHRFDAVIDFDQTTRDPRHPRRLLPAFDGGDHLHMNPPAYRALAAAVPACLFARD